MIAGHTKNRITNMRKVLLAAVMIFAGAAWAQTPANPTLQGLDSNKTDTHDRGVGVVRMKLAAPGSTGGGTQLPPPPPNPVVVPSPEDDVPPSEINPPPPGELPPTYYDEPCQGKFAFLLDASGSMYGSRIASVRQETTNVISLLTENDEFDACAYGSQFAAPTYTTFMWGGLQPATSGNKSSAINWVNGSATNPGGGTPTYACLKTACQVYPVDLDKMFLLTDGYPNVSGSASQILADFPAWWTHFTDCTLVCICIGGVGSAQTFMQQLAAQAGGIYIQR